jgi:hypothetical protein
MAHWKAEIKTRTFAAEGLQYMLLGWKVWPIVMCCLVSPISEGDFIWVLINENPKKVGPTQNTQKDFKRVDLWREQILIRST